MRSSWIPVPERLVPTRAWAFWLGVLTLLLALVGPLEHATDTSAAWHMTQHLLLLAVAAPLVVLGAPAQHLAWLVPGGWARRVRRNPALRAVSRATPVLVALAIIVHSAVLAAWHLPGLYDAAVRNPAVHVLEHLTFVGAGVFLWWTLLHASRARLAVGVIALFIAALPGTALGVLMTFAHTGWYSVYGTGPGALGDQQLAGVVMWAVGNTIYLIAAVALFAAWLSSMERATPARPAAAARP
jgi:putative membrane protein